MTEHKNEQERFEILKGLPFVGIDFVDGTTFALTGENAGFWVEGYPTHMSRTAPPTQEIKEGIVALLRRGNDVREWPDDEAAAYRDNGGFAEGRAAVDDLRVQKIVELVTHGLAEPVEFPVNHDSDRDRPWGVAVKGVMFDFSSREEAVEHLKLWQDEGVEAHLMQLHWTEVQP